MKMGLEFRFKKNIWISSVKPGHSIANIYTYKYMSARWKLLYRYNTAN